MLERRLLLLLCVHTDELSLGTQMCIMDLFTTRLVAQWPTYPCLTPEYLSFLSNYSHQGLLLPFFTFTSISRRHHAHFPRLFCGKQRPLLMHDSKNGRQIEVVISKKRRIYIFGDALVEMFLDFQRDESSFSRVG